LEISNIGLGKGELEAMALYKKINSDFLLIDDKLAKSFAKLNGVNVIGSMGVLILVKERGFIKNIRKDLEKWANANLFISQALIDKVLHSIGE